MRKEIWLKIGQSNGVGHDTNNPTIYHDTLDAVHPKVFEFSRGLDKTGFYRAAPYGEIMAYRHPAQDDNSGIGFGQCFGKERAYLNPDLEQIIIINRGVGANSFSKNRWNVGDDLYNLAVNDLKLAMIKNPDAIFRGILWHQGEGDTISFTQEMYQNALLSMYNGIIAEAMSIDSERVDVIFVCGTMVEKWIKANETLRRPIDLAHRNVANYIPNSVVADLKGVTDLNDSIHFGNDGLRQMGKIYATATQSLTSTNHLSYKIKVVDGELIDLYGGGGKVFKPTFAMDTERGKVLHSKGTGFQTSMVLNSKSYTKAGWVKMKAIPKGYGNFISGNIQNDLTKSHYFGYTGSGQGGSSTSAKSTGLSSYLLLNQWVHVALTYNGLEHKLYVNGELKSSIPMVSLIDSPQIVELFTINRNNSSVLNAYGDDIVISPYAMSDAQILDLYNE